MSVVGHDARANPLAGNPLTTRGDVQRAVVDLYRPLLPHVSSGGAHVRLGSFGASFEEGTAELEAFARPLYGIVPLTVGGGEFPHWDRILDGLVAGTDPDGPEYWGPVDRDGDQRMVEQASIGVALAFCPERCWDPLDDRSRTNLARWLHGIFEHEPVASNWQFFRVLVSLGLERVGAPVDPDAVARSLDLLETWRRGEHWYVDGELGTVDYYVPMAFHTYGLLYAAANDLGLGDDTRGDRFRDRAAAFAEEFQLWFGPDGAAIAMGRSLTYRFAVSSFWGALAWADVEPPMGWGAVRGLALRNLRWWADKPISDRDGVLSVGYGYDNRRLSESYNSPGSPYWAMKAFLGLAARPDHPFWSAAEAPLPPLDRPRSIDDAGWVVARDADQGVALIGRPSFAVEIPEQAPAKYQKFVYSSGHAFAGDVKDFFGRIATDSALALTDDDDRRVVRLGVDAGGGEDDMTWATWRPFDDVRVDSVCWFTGEGTVHGRLHRIRAGRLLHTAESGFAVACRPTSTTDELTTPGPDGGHALVGVDGRSVLVDAPPQDGVTRRAATYRLAVNAHLLHPHTAVPVLLATLAPGDHLLGCTSWAGRGGPPPLARAPVAEASALLERISAR